jgi:hypothetical protein
MIQLAKYARTATVTIWLPENEQVSLPSHNAKDIVARGDALGATNPFSASITALTVNAPKGMTRMSFKDESEF